MSYRAVRKIEVAIAMRRTRRASDLTGIKGGRLPMTSLVQFLAVAEHLNFRHAANVLGTTQSSVSTRIKALEETLGVLLFERRHRAVRLTEAGRQFQAGVSTGIDLLDHAVKTIGAVSRGTTGRLDVGLVACATGACLADLRRRFRETSPEVGQVITEGPSAQTAALVREGRLDVAFVLEPVEAPDCHSRLLWTEPYVIAMAEDHPLAVRRGVAWTDLASATFLLRTGGAGPQLFDHIVRRMAECGRSSNVRRYDIGRDMLMHMVAGKDGISLASETAQYMRHPGIVFRPIIDETEPARFSAIWSPHNRNSALHNLPDLAARSGPRHVAPDGGVGSEPCSIAAMP